MSPYNIVLRIDSPAVERFSKVVVMCMSHSNVLSNEKYGKETIKDYFRQLSSMLWTMEHEWVAILMEITEHTSPLCIFDSLKCPMFQFVVMDKIVLLCDTSIHFVYS